ncbi:hypothetical protein CVT24_011429 [Panaeolus cyanescens]|uniref:Uncharacterized protein n=1 Tax=Panaeolus cyanescens TaxID=181874 RepID=A0A409YGT6_9AGAR|nr:hypothetical protein CVT24_011429 [Panaeolus cyanescens]
MSKMVIVDDVDPRIQYDGVWNLDTTTDNDAKGNYGSVYQTTQHWTTGNNNFTFSFEGSFIAVLGSNNPDSAWECSIDGVKLESNTFEHWENNWWFCQSAYLEDGPHTITVRADAANNQRFWFDRILYAPSAHVSLTNEALYIDNLDPGLHYGTGWRINGLSANITNVDGAKFTYEFHGSSVRWYGYVSSGRPPANASYTIDGGPSTTFEVPIQPSGGISLFNYEYFRTPDVEVGRHTLLVEHHGEPDATELILDYLEVHNGVVSASTTPTSVTVIPAVTNRIDNTGPNPDNLNQSTVAEKRSTPAGAIVGGVLGGLALILFICLVIFYLVARRRKENQTSQSNAEKSLGADTPYTTTSELHHQTSPSPTSFNVTSAGTGSGAYFTSLETPGQIPPSKLSAVRSPR